MDSFQQGQLAAKVENLEKRLENLEDKVDRLVSLAERSKGGIWAGIAIVSTLSAIVSWIAQHFLFR